ncbi:bridge-like lipid transfer protein family member 3A isoform X1 [Hemiscyllium ocellatum]|uniref:bridge-like lipid transfer protein family member 3A isoform X1 n=1 Tax=Hemiscyllium ocellatum TaxID=170820 RepID=UPI002965E842|nr:bridge-like lipid transfer protein family member 3A isoform X1 [Hemiscyllium ocellatum]
MAGLIKKQILKHLSRFTKNLSPDKINVSTLKGEGQLTNLELDEEVLQNVLDLPTWLAITRVYCNRAAIRIQWTKLKTHPICLFLDKVEVEMRTCEEPRPPNGPSPIAITAGQSEYGFAEKVVEGMSIVVNSIVVKIEAKAFNTSFELWQLQGYSVNPKWQQSDLRFTRITDPERGEVLTFKEINWQTLRIEADAIPGDQSIISTPLRLITNQSKIKLVLKRRVKDCNVVGSKLMFLLGDLLWVLTDSQLKAMIEYAQSLSEAMENSATQRKRMAPDAQGTSGSVPSVHQTRMQPASSSNSLNSISQYFDLYDVKESSYHSQISRLDLHICDDGASMEQGGSKHRIAGGAIQLTFRNLSFDYYPFHWANDSCKHWVRHCETMEARSRWAKDLLQEFQSKVQTIIDHHEGLTVVRSPTKESPGKRKGSPTRKVDAGKRRASDQSASVVDSDSRQPPWNRLLSSCVVIRIDDLDVYQVSAAGQHSKKPTTLLSCNRTSYHLPAGMSAIHIEFTEYYFPDSKEFPVPSPNLYVNLNTLQFTLDPVSMLWMNSFFLDLYQTLQQFKAIYKLNNSVKVDEHVDFCMNGLMLKFIIPVDKKIIAHPDRPQYLTIQTSDVVATNTRHSLNCTHSDLQLVLKAFKDFEFFHVSYKEFPKCADSFDVLQNVFFHHAFEQQINMDRIYTQKNCNYDVLKTLSAADIWSLHFSLLWLDFEGMESSKGKPLNFVDAFPLSIWVSQPSKFQKAKELSSHSASECSTDLEDCNTSLNHKLNLSSCKESLGNGLQANTKQDFMGAEVLRSSKGIGEEGKLREASKQDDSEADVHVLVYSTAHVKAHLNHYHYLVLLRLKEYLIQLQEDLSQDVERWTKTPVKYGSTCIGLLIKSAEIALLLHPAPTGHDDAKSHESESTSLTESELSPSGSKESLTMEVKPLNRATTDQLDDTITSMDDSGIHNGDLSIATSLDLGVLSQDGMLVSSAPVSNSEEMATQTLEKGLVEEAFEAVESLEVERPGDVIDHSTSHPILATSTSLILDPQRKSRSSGGNVQAATVPFEDVDSTPLTVTKDVAKEALLITVDFTKEAVCLTKDAFSLSKEKMASTMQKMLSLSSSREQLSKGEDGLSPSLSSTKLRFLNMKRTNSQHSLDTTSLDGSLTEDRISVDSDGSEKYVILLEAESGQESLPPDSNIHTACEMGSNRSLPECVDGGHGAQGFHKPSTMTNSSTQSEDDSNAEQASVLLLKVFDLNCGIDIKGDDLFIGVQAKEVIPDQLGNLGVQQFLSSRTTGFQKACSLESKRTQPAVCLRFESGPHSAVLSPLAVKNGFLQFHINNYNAELLMSSLTNLGPFLEDETIPEVIPMKIELFNCRLTLKDDGPRLYATSSGPVPLHLDVDRLMVQRIDDGTFCVRALQTDQNEPVLTKLETCLATTGSHQTQPGPIKNRGMQSLSESQSPSDLGISTTKDMQNEILRQELASMKEALTKANQDRERLLQEVQKLNPDFKL